MRLCKLQLTTLVFIYQPKSPISRYYNKKREQVFNVLDQIASQSKDNDELVKKAIRLVKRAGVPMEKTYLEKYANYLVSTGDSSKTELGKTDTNQRRQDVETRKQWEQQNEENQSEQPQSTRTVGKTIASNVEGKSALSRRAARAAADGSGNTKPDIFMPSILNPDNIATIAYEKEELQKEMNGKSGSDSEDVNGVTNGHRNDALILEASNKVSKIVANAGSDSNFEGEILGIGGLDDVLRQIRRRVWIPLAAPPQLLDELGIHPGRLLAYMLGECFDKFVCFIYVYSKYLIILSFGLSYFCFQFSSTWASTLW